MVSANFKEERLKPRGTKAKSKFRRRDRGAPITKEWLMLHTEKQGDCLVWLKYRVPTGYGQLKTENGVELAHRVSYRLHYGKIYRDLHILHHCDNPPCINPDHLWAGTNSDNIRDRVSKGRPGNPGRPGTGPSTKLTVKRVLQIRRLWSTGKVTQQSIAEIFGIARSNVSMIIRRATWPHI